VNLPLLSTGHRDESERLALTHSGELVRRKKLFVKKRQLTIIFRGGFFMLEREEELLNSKQVAVILDLSPDTVNEFARKNILPAFKKGKQWRFRKRDISIFYRKQSRDIRDA
jgi:excisionase family DNA binding protein